jgi:ATP-dependent Zn protease
MDAAVAGRIAEDVIYGLDNVETGAETDFQHMMHIARNYVMRWGFSDKVQIFWCLVLKLSQVGFYFVHDDELTKLSVEQRSLFEQEVRKLIDESSQRVRNLLASHREELERIKDALLEYETVTGEELKKIIRGEKIRSGKGAVS